MKLWIPENCIGTVKGRAVYWRTLPDLTRIYHTIWNVNLFMWYKHHYILAEGKTLDILKMANQCSMPIQYDDGILHAVKH